jgi:glucose/arabinose dehydrogenase
MIRARTLALVVALAAAALPASASAIRLTPVATGLASPLLVTAPPGDARLFVVEKPGRVRIVRAGRLLPTPFLNVVNRVSTGGEQGLLGLAFHPKYADNGRFYVNYTDRGGDTRVVEYRVSSSPNRAAAGSARVILTVDQPYANHNGGHIAFGPDGMLYIGMGDGGSGGDPENHGQRTNTLLGKMLRIDVDTPSGGRPYGIPAGNAFPNGGGRAEILHWGLRNPWRFSFDRASGDLWMGDVGQNAIEEIDFAPKGSSGLNFGWNAFEGTKAFGGTANGPTVNPVAQYTHSKGCSVTGGYVYRGSRVPSLRGRYVYADFCSGRTWSMRAGPRPGDVREITGRLSRSLKNVFSFGEDAAGEMYVMADDKVLRFAGP